MATLRLLDGLSGPSASSGDSDPIVTALEFSVDDDASATAVWWWQATTGASSAARTVAIYPAAGGAYLGISSAVSPSGTGWQRVELSPPIALTPGSYRAAVLHPSGQYSSIGYWFQSGSGNPGESGFTNGILHAPNGDDFVGPSGQGSFVSSATMAFPNNSYQYATYWVDVEVETAEDPTPLDTPEVTVDDEINPTSPGGADGVITISFDAVPHAVRYEVGIAIGHDQTTGFTEDSDDADSPYDLTGLTAGDYTVAVKAYPS